MVFSVVQELEPAKAAYADLKGRMAKYGHEPDELAVLPGVMPIVGETDGQARETLAKLQSWITPTNAATLVASRIGYDVSGYPLDGPVPAPPPPLDLNSRTFPAVLYEMAQQEKMTLRDLYNLMAAARGHWAVCGTPHPPTGSTSCRRGSRVPSMTSWTMWCRRCSGGVCSGLSTAGGCCGIISSKRHRELHESHIESGGGL